MAYDKDKILKQALEIAENKHHFFIEDIISLLPISKPTFYDYFPVESNELNNIKEKLDQNKISMKVEIREKLSRGEKSAELLALYKLICSSDERKSLSMNYTDVTSGDKPLQQPITIIYKGEELDIKK
jgi:hypothetical protein